MVKKFTTNCDFSGKKAPITLYVGDPAIGSHPLGFQSTWLGKARGGTVPTDIMDAFAKLKDVSEKNKVPFEDLCAYVIEELNSSASLQGDAKKATEISGDNANEDNGGKLEADNADAAEEQTTNEESDEQK
jgi:hypothetical protein